MTNNKILETWLKWLRNGEWYNVTDDIERLLLEPERDICWCGVPLTKPDMPTKIFAPNLEQILNAAGFYRREWVGLTDDDCIEAQKNSWNEYKNGKELKFDGFKLCKNIEQILKEKNT